MAATGGERGGAGPQAVGPRAATRSQGPDTLLSLLLSVHTGPRNLGQIASLSSAGLLLCPLVFPVSGPSPAPGSALPKRTAPPPSPQGCDKRPTQQGPP